jgi:hypothetical protein
VKVVGLAEGEQGRACQAERLTLPRRATLALVVTRMVSQEQGVTRIPAVLGKSKASRGFQQYLEKQEARKLEKTDEEKEKSDESDSGKSDSGKEKKPPLKRQKTTTEETDEEQEARKKKSYEEAWVQELAKTRSTEQKSDSGKEKDPKMREKQRWREALSRLATESEHHRLEWMPEHLCEEGQEPTLWVLSKNDEWVETTITKSFMKKEGCCDVCDRRL